MPQQGLTRHDLYRAILFATAVYLAIKFISAIADVLLIFSITALLVSVLNPAVSWLEKKRIPRQASASVLAVSVIALVVLVLYLILPLAGRQLAELIKQAPQFATQAEGWIAKLGSKYPALHGVLPQGTKIDGGTFRQLATPFFGGVSRITESALGAIIGAFLVFITTIYILANPKPISEGVLRAFNPEQRPRVEAAATRLGCQIRAWAAGLSAGMFAIFLLSWIALTIIGIRQAFLFAVFAGFMEAVPVIGPLISAIPPIIVALVQSPFLVVWVMLSYTAIQQIESHILVPMIMSRQLSIHPITVIFSVLVMGGLFGIIGVFLATPAAAVAGILYDELYIYPREGVPASNDEESE